MQVATVSQVNSYIKSVLDSNDVLKNIYIVGEISNFKDYNGNLYLTLKDEKSTLKTVMFSSYSSKLKFDIANGMSVICRGSVSVYDKIGTYQLYIYDMQPDGVGALTIAFEQLKEKLTNEGLFLEQYKKPIPKYPKRIGVVTSNKGAAVEDIKKILKRRFPLSEVLIVPTIVQGDLAPKDIVDSINYLNSLDDVDVMIVGRGGGSIEDLWAFNTEIVARSVFNSNIPVISAVGHETDFTICDFVADLRAATPSAAAELAVPDMYTELVNIANLNNSLKSNINYFLNSSRQHLDTLSNSSCIKNVESLTSLIKEKLSSYTEKMTTLINNKTLIEREKFSSMCGMLNSLSPLAVLSRGYSISFKNGNSLKSVNEVNKSDKICVNLIDGTIDCTVNEVNTNE